MSFTLIVLICGYDTFIYKHQWILRIYSDLKSHACSEVFLHVQLTLQQRLQAIGVRYKRVFHVEQTVPVRTLDGSYAAVVLFIQKNCSFFAILLGFPSPPIVFNMVNL